MKEAKKIAKFLNLNKVIWLLTFSDIFSWGLYLAITSMVGIYLANRLGMNALEVVGVGVGIYYLARALASIPVGLITDKIERDRDDIIFLTIGNLLMGITFLFYPVILSPGVFYVLQIIFGIGAAMNLVTWRKLFARNLDEKKEGFTYALYDTIMSAAIAVFSLLAGVISNISQDYFDGVMMIIGLIIMLSSIMPALIFDVRTRKSL